MMVFIVFLLFIFGFLKDTNCVAQGPLVQYMNDMDRRDIG